MARAIDRVADAFADRFVGDGSIALGDGFEHGAVEAVIEGVHLAVEVFVRVFRSLDTYTPGINDSPTVIKAKLASLQSFIQTTTRNIYQTAGAANLATDTVTQADGSVWQRNQDGSYTQIR